jgi:hypothetical protein
MTNYVVVGYHTPDLLYMESAGRLKASLSRFKIPHYIEEVPSKGSWYANTNYKPTFLKAMLQKFFPANIVYVDCDAEFKKYPKLFDNFPGDVGVYIFDRAEYGKNNKGTEVLSGTIYLRSNDKVSAILNLWEEECTKNPLVWDQKNIEKILNGYYTLLPWEYCKIFDRMKHIKNPVIVHYQASRKIKNKHKESGRVLSKQGFLPLK